MSKSKKGALRQPGGNDYYRSRTSAEFLRDYNRHTKGYRIHAETGEQQEGHFSWRPCQTCGSTLGGDRFDCVLTNAGKRARQREVSSCVDCIAFAANGTLPNESR